MPRRHIRHAVVAAAFLVAHLLTGAISVAASTTGTGAFEGTVTLADGFPCATCGGGSLNGTAALSLAGAPSAGVAYEAVWPDPRTGAAVGELTAAFSYTDNCLVTAPIPPTTGSADGTFTLKGGMLVLNGTVWDNASLTGGFSWFRVGATAQFVVVGLQVTGGSGSSTVAVNLNNAVVGEGLASFAWTNGPGTCTVQNPVQTALVTGSLVQPV